MADDPAQIDRAVVFFALKEIAAHPSVASVTEPVFGTDGASATAVVDLRLGSRWKAQGGSPTGALPHEEVQFDFPAAFPAQPPEFSLRPDFNRNHPHIQPWLMSDGRVVPCLVDGNVGEFIAASGFHGLMDQISVWLESAARGDLMNPEQGWEPTRRDGYPDLFISEAAKLRALVDRKGGFRFFRMVYGFAVTDDFTPFFFGELGEQTTIQADIRESRPRPDSKLGRGEGMAIVVWPGKHPNGDLAKCNKYLPDDFRTAGELLERMDAFGTRPHVQGALALLKQRASVQPGKSIFPLVIINLVRRPYKLIGTDSDIEICGYVVPLRSPEGPLVNPTDEVRPLAHRHAMEPGLLRQMSGDPETRKWVLLGCGSLGSKVAMHSTRSGNAPAMVADKSLLSPHNAARHALYPNNNELQIGWLSGKADALATALEAFGSPVKALGDDHVALAQEMLTLKGKNTKPQWLVNTTASMVVQESYSQASMEGLPRIIEMALYDGGRLGYLGIDGEGHNPNGVELEASLYQHAASTPALGRHLFKPVGGAAPVAIGQGCGSLTIRMSDATLSVMAGAMTELFSSLPDAEPGTLHTLRRDGVGLAHDRLEIPPFERVAVEGMEGWRMSVAADVYRRIVDDAARYPKTETGGVLVGWSSMIARQIVVTDIIDAPADSVRKRTKFELGMDGLTAKLADLHVQSGGLLRCLGTWHSHLGSAEPSTIDRLSAALVGAGYTQPMTFLILGTDGLRAICIPAAVVEIEAPTKRKRRA